MMFVDLLSRGNSIEASPRLTALKTATRNPAASTFSPACRTSTAGQCGATVSAEAQETARSAITIPPAFNTFIWLFPKLRNDESMLAAHISHLSRRIDIGINLETEMFIYCIRNRSDK